MENREKTENKQHDANREIDRNENVVKMKTDERDVSRQVSPLKVSLGDLIKNRKLPPSRG